MAEKHLPKLIDNIALHQIILNNNNNSQQIRILDCTFLPKPRDPKTFNAKFYGKFEEQVNENEPNFRDAYSRFLARSIPTSIHFNLGLATYPTPRDKFALYSPKIFQHYVQLLGINSDDHLVFYGRDKLGGMLFAARAYWLFKAYSQSDTGLSILNGGLDAWIKAKLPTKIDHQSDRPFAKNKGNWTGKDPSNHFIEFNDFANNDENKLSENRIILDARPREQFQGLDLNPTKLFASHLPTTTHLPGAINIPSNELVDSDGMMISPEKLQGLLENEGLNIGECEKSMVTYCNAGNQASLLAAAMDLQLDFKNLRVFGGSIF